MAGRGQLVNAGGQPILILKEGATRTRGEEAQSMNIEAARAVANAVRTTLGPKGMDKMLVDSIGDVVITNDGATILKEMDIEHPAAKMVVEVAKTQDDEVGDGTTTAAVLVGELLKESEELLSIFTWGHTFFELNGALLDSYAQAKDSGEIVRMQNSLCSGKECG